MTSTSSRRCRTALATIVLAVGMGTAVAPASGDDGPRSAKNGRGSESRKTEGRSSGSAANREAVTEDNDDNDGNTANNVPDQGDNAHPSGRDRSVERGRSGNQGASTADPDGRSNRGPDKPGGAGGTDLADQDGNNGCGNDDDFEDDNHGRCGARERTRRRVLQRTATTTTTTTTVAAGGGGDDGGASDGRRPSGPAAVGDTNLARSPGVSMAPRIETEVLGVSFERPRHASRDTPGAGGAAALGTSFDRRGVLARTGPKLVPIALAALVMAVFGFGLTRLGHHSTT